MEYERGWRELHAARKKGTVLLGAMLLCWIGFVPLGAVFGLPAALLVLPGFYGFFVMSSQTLGRAVCPCCGGAFFVRLEGRRTIKSRTRFCMRCGAALDSIPPAARRARLQPIADAYALRFVHERALEGHVGGAYVAIEQPAKGAPRTIVEAEARSLRAVAAHALEQRITSKAPGVRFLMSGSRVRVELPGSEPDTGTVSDVLDVIAEASAIPAAPYRA